MSERRLAQLLFQVLGVYVAATAVAYAGTAYSNWKLLPERRSEWEGVALAMPIVTTVFVGGVLWFFASELARAAFRETIPEPVGLSISASDLYRVMVSVLGLSLIVDAAPTVMYWLALWVQSSPDNPSAMGGFGLTERDVLFDMRANGDFVRVLTQIVVGLVLFRGPQRILSWARQEFGSRLLKDDVETP